ncbi:MAG: AMP-binding protein [Desulfuromonadaceae bacterium]|nr:AMP-binding protein [Desulfuromonadaceae bacterium]
MTTENHANIALSLTDRARRQPEVQAVICPQGRDRYGHVSYTHLNYRQLDGESDRLAWVLARQGIGAGTRTVLMVKPGLEFFALTFALFKVGAIPILIDPGMGVKNIRTCLSEVAPEAFIGIPKAHLARLLLGWGKQTLRCRISTGSALFSLPLLGTDSLTTVLAASPQLGPYPCFAADDTTLAAILFTSGSTGSPKGACYSHANFNAQISALKGLYQIQPGEYDLCTFPLFALFAPALGMTAVVPDMDATRPGQVNPERIFEALDNFTIHNLFGSPALLRRLTAYGHHYPDTCRPRLASLKRVISAGAPVPATVLEELSTLLPHDTQIFTPYGATESLPVCSIGSHEILRQTRTLTDQGRGICVGRPVAGLDVQVIAIEDGPIANWEQAPKSAVCAIGEICVRGPQVTRAYDAKPEATALAKVPCADGGFYHRMGDVGYFDDQGRLWFCGRKAHRVEIGNNTLFTIPCEAVFNTHPDVFRTALVGCGARAQRQAVLCIELNPGVNRSRKPAIIAELQAIQRQFPHTQAISAFLFHPRFPVDIRHNAKIFREKLSLWAEKQLHRSSLFAFERTRS